MDLALNNLPRSICHKLTNQPVNQITVYFSDQFSLFFKSLVQFFYWMQPLEANWISFFPK